MQKERITIKMDFMIKQEKYVDNVEVNVFSVKVDKVKFICVSLVRNVNIQ